MITKTRNEMIDAIIKFWEEERPYIIGPIKLCKFFRRAASDCVIEFLDNNLQNYKTYPWNRKIFEKRKEIFGF